jgi:ribosomal protein S18 acetylase RimI-like enzyme
MSADDAWRQQGTFWLLDADRTLPAGMPARVPTKFMRASADSASALAGLMGVEREQVLRRFAAGSRCYVAEVGGEWAAYGWVSFHEEHIGEIGLHIRLRPGEAYIWDCATMPDFRRLGLYTGLLAHIAGALRAEHFTRIWIGADTDNTPSQVGIAAVGFQPVVDLFVQSNGAAPYLELRERAGTARQVVDDVRAMLHGAGLR